MLSYKLRRLYPWFPLIGGWVDTRAGLDDVVITGTAVSSRIAIIQPVASAVAAGLLPAVAEGNAARHNFNVSDKHV